MKKVVNIILNTVATVLAIGLVYFGGLALMSEFGGSDKSYAQPKATISSSSSKAPLVNDVFADLVHKAGYDCGVVLGWDDLGNHRKGFRNFKMRCFQNAGEKGFYRSYVMTIKQSAINLLAEGRGLTASQRPIISPAPL